MYKTWAKVMLLRKSQKANDVMAEGKKRADAKGLRSKALKLKLAGPWKEARQS